MLGQGDTPLVQAAADLGTASEWAATLPAATKGTSGFGRLTARRSGKTKDAEQALRALPPGAHHDEIRDDGDDPGVHSCIANSQFVAALPGQQTAVPLDDLDDPG